MYDRLMKYTAIWSITFFVIMMTVMLYAAFHIEPAVAQKQPEIETEQESEAIVIENEKELAIAQEGVEQAYLCIPLSDNITEEQLLLEADYVEQKLLITIDGLEKSFYDTNHISGNDKCIDKIYYSYQKGKSILQLQLSGLYEHNVFCKNNMLYIEFKSPREQYDKIIVVDAAKGSSMANEIVNQLKKEMEQTDIKVYYTGLDESNPDIEKRVALANLVKADMLIGVATTPNMTKEEVQTAYNATFFIPKLSSVALADILEKNVCKATGCTAGGLIPAGAEDVFVNASTVPVAVVTADYTSTKQESDYAEDAAYVENFAKGIYNGIMDTYKKLEETN